MKKHKRHRMYPYERKQKAIQIRVEQMSKDFQCFNKPIQEAVDCIKNVLIGEVKPIRNTNGVAYD